MRKKMMWVGVLLVLLAAFPLVAVAQTAVGTGGIVADGDGTAYLRGAGWVRVSGNGTLAIRDRAGDADIVVTGNGTRRTQGSTVIYQGFDGEAFVRGSAITVGLRGGDIHLEAVGSGIVFLRGEGWYRVGHGDHALEGQWTAEGVRLQLDAGGMVAE